MPRQSTSLTTTTATLALSLIASVAPNLQSAQAKVPAGHLAAALLGIGAINAALGRAGTYDDGSGGSRRCGWVRRYDAYGNYTGKVRSCS